MMYKMTNGHYFDIIVNNEEIVFIDDNSETLTWDNNITNKQLVDKMVDQITGVSNE